MKRREQRKALNTDIAFFRSGMTGACKRSIEKIINANVAAGKSKTMFEIIGSESNVMFYTDAENGGNVGLNETQRKIIDLMVVMLDIRND